MNFMNFSFSLKLREFTGPIDATMSAVTSHQINRELCRPLLDMGFQFQQAWEGNQR